MASSNNVCILFLVSSSVYHSNELYEKQPLVVGKVSWAHTDVSSDEVR